ncbi:MAG: LytR/AlgR family response regulator transcription factor [Pyrinomonadaceae bacterium]
MDQARINNQKFWNIGLILVCWTLYGLFFASQSYVRQAYFGRNPDWQNALAVWLTCGYSWAILTPPILFVARRFPFNRCDWVRALAIQIPSSVFFSVVALAIFVGVRMLFGENYSFGRFRNLVIDDIHSGVLVYFGILGVNSAIAYFCGPSRPASEEHRAALNGSAVPRKGEMLEEPPAIRKTPNTQETTPQPGFTERFTVKENGRIVLISVRDIDRITSDGNYVKLYTNGKWHLLRKTMKAMEQKLDPSVFLRVRRSAIVRIEQIKELHPLFNGEFEIVLKNGTKISSSRRYRKNLDALLK